MKITKRKSALLGLAATTLLIRPGFTGCVYGPGGGYEGSPEEWDGVVADTAPEQARVFVEITETDGDTILVKPEDGAWELNSSDAFSIPKDRLSDDIKPEEGMWLEVIYSGSVNETYPASFSGISSISVAEYPGRRDTDTPDDTVNEDRVTAGGPYGEISVILPKTWTAEAAPVDSDKMMYGLYGLILKPEGVSEGQIELFCSDSFGVCGTGLEEEETTLAGVEAHIGTYDSHPHWDFIIFKTDTAQIDIVAQHTDCDSWTDEMWDEAFSILDTMQFDEEKTEGGVGQSNPGSYDDTIAVQMSVSHVTPTGLTVHFTQYDKRDCGELIYGEGYHLEVLNGDIWEDVPTIIEDWGFNSIGYTLPAEGEAEIETNWEWLYGKLSPGTYRITKILTDSSRNDPAVSIPAYPLMAQFMIAGDEL